MFIFNSLLCTNLKYLLCRRFVTILVSVETCHWRIKIRNKLLAARFIVISHTKRVNVCCIIQFVLMDWSVVLRIYVALAVFQPYHDLEAGENQSLKFKWRGRESNPGPLAPQAKSLTTRPPLLPVLMEGFGLILYEMLLWNCCTMFWSVIIFCNTLGIFR